VDANVLFPLTLRDTLLRAAAEDLFQLRWSIVVVAVKSGAQVITTSNLKDFARLPEGLEAQSPDEFLCSLFDLDPEGFNDLLRQQAGDLRNPPVTLDGLLQRLSKQVPGFVAAVRSHLVGVPRGT